MARDLTVWWMNPWEQARCWKRVRNGLASHAPRNMRVVDAPGQGEDIVIADVFSPASLQRVIPGKRTVLIVHGPAMPSYLPQFRDALLVVGFLDLPAMVQSDDFRFLRSPWGVDGSVFYPRPSVPRDRIVLTTGEDYKGEVIRECFEAGRRARGLSGQSIQVGYPFDWSTNPIIKRDILDDEMAECYSRVLYVSGLRRGPGFELPVVEGLACGARPVCFDQPWYRYWFDGHAVFIPEVENPTEILVEVFKNDPDPVTLEERELVLRKFSWPVIAANFWESIAGCVAF
jgi:glycosyltransferase involved in cell wall biosynthesis